MKLTKDNRRLPRDVWALGFVSLFMDISSETVYGILPLFLFSVLGASVTSIGFLEGVAEATALILKVISGPLSDLLKKRKPLIILGYSMGALSKPLFAIATSVPFVFAVRVFDRMGKGIRGASRDAMLADIAPEKMRGESFGVRQALDTTGAYLGPLLAIFLLWLTHNNFRVVFWIAGIPGVLSVLVLYFGVREKEHEEKTKSKIRLKFSELKQFHISFWFISVVGAVFQLARFSDAFLILRGKDLGIDVKFTPFILIVMYAVYSLASYPVGRLSDKIRREWFLIAGFIVLMMADMVLAYAQNLYVGLIGIGLWGFHMGLSKGTLETLVADTCPSNYRGTSYGIFNLFSAIALLIASTIAGILWDQFGPKATFLASAAISLLSLLLFVVSKPIWSKRNLASIPRT